MIQELLGINNLSNHTAPEGLAVNVGEKEASPHPTGVVQPSYIAPSPLPSSSSSTTTTTNPKPSSENLTPLRCPRCDSSNTKFCYYNNYNLTQPRHFCKTCRRYWTKGGALRNVPIGGGCRKNNKTTNISHAISSSLEKSSSSGKLIRSHLLTSSENIGKVSAGGFDQGLSTNSLLWTSPQTSHLLALLRSNQTQNPNPNFNYSIINSVKEQGFLNGSGGLRLMDPYNNNHLSSFWRNDERPQAELQQQSCDGFVMQNLSNQDQVCNQRVSFKSTENYYSDNYAPGLVMGNGHAPSANCSDILESTPVVGGSGQLVSCWNTRPDLPTANGAYH